MNLSNKMSLLCNISDERTGDIPIHSQNILTMQKKMMKAEGKIIVLALMFAPSAKVL